MFAAPPVIKPEIFARLPERLRATGPRGNVLEGPSFDRNGNLFMVDIRQGRILKLSPAAEFTVVVEYDGEPNGLRIHRDGRIFVADHKRGLMLVDPVAGTIKTLIDRAGNEPFKGLNDLIFDSNGDLFFTDQGESGLHDPTGRLWCLRADGRLQMLLGNIPSPNGLVPGLDESVIHVGVTRANAIWRVPVEPDGTIGRVGVFVQMSGGAGPDGMALDEAGNLAVAHVGFGSVWVFSPIGRPIAEIRCETGPLITNIAYGGADHRTLHIIGSDVVLTARMEVPGRRMFSHL